MGDRDTKEPPTTVEKYARISTPTPVILMLGDSITELGADPNLLGYQVLLTHAYQRKADVVNRGMSARTTRWWVAQLPRVVADWEHKHPSLISIFLGVNDASVPGNTPLHVPLNEFEANVHSLLNGFSAAFPACAFVLVTPSAVDERSPWGTLWKNDRAATYAASVLALGIARRVPVVDLYTPTEANLNLFFDGLHLGKEGNVLLHQLWLNAVRSHLPHLAPENLKWAF
ncbi:hypothetical protein SDRG_02200 [Saprolegnia diclina VS20]|uniref:SGNH hydrolase-type esterase domain-containing protein n=1 Tax=Saprolegnia diclina (strain VS20) TaxID=1156394 RepID=T0S575_SAPDV|nr:hypothetical protein SDRG_02200 [Saprolegnia diclina VS20]EQC40298.1 hypothetical protein SDRG_02200 [Saprolegnia diclina VS20]|eukprot:XP_008605997.1 hypothetical protein SDRG_02200 [Saprolegnia diclina VS20]